MWRLPIALSSHSSCWTICILHTTLAICDNISPWKKLISSFEKLSKIWCQGRDYWSCYGKNLHRIPTWITACGVALRILCSTWRQVSTAASNFAMSLLLWSWEVLISSSKNMCGCSSPMGKGRNFWPFVFPSSISTAHRLYIRLTLQDCVICKYNTCIQATASRMLWIRSSNIRSRDAWSTLITLLVSRLA